MKTVSDPTQSKRPIQVPEAEDIHQLYMKKEFAQAEIDLLETEIEKLKNSSAFSLIVQRSQQREQELLMAIACTDPTESIKIATMQGQLAERKKLTSTIISLQNEVKLKKGVVGKLADTIQKWAERMKRWQAKQGEQ